MPHLDGRDTTRDSFRQERRPMMNGSVNSYVIPQTNCLFFSCPHNYLHSAVLDMH